jgi:hypothetical protein
MGESHGTMNVQTDQLLGAYADLLRKYGHTPRLYQIPGRAPTDGFRCLDCGQTVRVSTRIPDEESIQPCL